MDKNNIKGHYDKLSSMYDDLWLYSEEFVDFISEKTIDFLEIKKSDILVDLGAGSGIYSKGIKRKIELTNDIICVDISDKMLEPVKLPGYKTIAEDAIQFSERQITYDKIFVKEMIHHISDNQKQELLNNIYSNLSKGGIFIILLLPPTIEYPLFNDAIKLYEKEQPHYNIIAEKMNKAGFKTDIEFIKYPLNIDKNQYFKMVKNRYMSTLSNFSNLEIEQGISEMEDKYKNHKHLSFDDVFVVIKGQK